MCQADPISASNFNMFARDKREPAAGQTHSNFIVADKISLYISQELPGYKGERRVWLNFEAGSCRSAGLILGLHGLEVRKTHGL